MKDAALAIVTNSKDQILLVKRKDVPIWVLPGGGIEERESAQEAVLRETLEETGLSTQVVDHVATYSPINRLASTTHLFYCSPINEEPLSLQCDEVADAQFFHLKKLPKHLFPLHLTFLKEWQLYRRELKNWDLGLAKVSGFERSKLAPYYNMKHVLVVESRELSFKPKTNFSVPFGITTRYPIERPLSEVTYLSVIWLFLCHPQWVLRYFWTRFFH